MPPALFTHLGELSCPWHRLFVPVLLAYDCRLLCTLATFPRVRPRLLILMPVTLGSEVVVDPKGSMVTRGLFVPGGSMCMALGLTRTQGRGSEVTQMGGH